MHRLALAATLAVIVGSAHGQETGPRVELRIGQDGIVGTTGTVYRIAPSGTWTVSTFINERANPPYATGALSAGEMAALAALLPEGPPATHPHRPGVNAFRIELRVDGRAYAVATTRGAGAAPCVGAGPECAVTGAANWITAHLGR